MLDNTNNKDLVDKRIMYNKKSLIACSIPITSVRVKGAMSLRNGMWHGLQNDTTMRNLIYGKWRKEKNSTGKHARVSAAPFLVPI